MYMYNYTLLVTNKKHSGKVEQESVGMSSILLLKLCNTEQEHEYDGNCSVLHD